MFTPVLYYYNISYICTYAHIHISIHICICFLCCRYFLFFVRRITRYLFYMCTTIPQCPCYGGQESNLYQVENVSLYFLVHMITTCIYEFTSPWPSPNKISIYVYQISDFLNLYLFINLKCTTYTHFIKYMYLLFLKK